MEVKFETGGCDITNPIVRAVRHTVDLPAGPNARYTFEFDISTRSTAGSDAYLVSYGYTTIDSGSTWSLGSLPGKSVALFYNSSHRQIGHTWHQSSSNGQEISQASWLTENVTLDGETEWTAPAADATAEWHHLAISWDGLQAKTYADGRLVKQTGAVIEAPSSSRTYWGKPDFAPNEFCLGGMSPLYEASNPSDTNHSQYHFRGEIKNFRIYDEAKSCINGFRELGRPSFANDYTGGVSGSPTLYPKQQLLNWGWTWNFDARLDSTSFTDSGNKFESMCVEGVENYYYNWIKGGEPSEASGRYSLFYKIQSGGEEALSDPPVYNGTGVTMVEGTNGYGTVFGDKGKLKASFKNCYSSSGGYAGLKVTNSIYPNGNPDMGIVRPLGGDGNSDYEAGPG